MNDHRSVRTVELPIRRAAGVVTMKPHQVQRDHRRNGKTTRAAARLAVWRLRRFLRAHNQMPVDDIEISVSEDFERYRRTVGASVRCVERHEALGDTAIRVPPSTTVLSLAVQS